MRTHKHAYLEAQVAVAELVSHAAAPAGFRCDPIDELEPRSLGMAICSDEGYGWDRMWPGITIDCTVLGWDNESGQAVGHGD